MNCVFTGMGSNVDVGMCIFLLSWHISIIIVIPRCSAADPIENNSAPAPILKR